MRVFLTCVPLLLGGCLMALAGGAAVSETSTAPPRRAPPRAWFVGAPGAPTVAPTVEMTSLSTAELERDGYRRAGWIVVRAGEAGTEGASLLRETAAGNGGGLYHVTWRGAHGTVTSRGGAGSVTGVNAGWNTGGGGMPFQSYGGGGGHSVLRYKLVLAVLWRRGAPEQPAEEPPWLTRWRERAARALSCSPAREADCDALEELAGHVTARPPVELAERERRCAAGEGRACCRLARIHHLGIGGVRRDEHQARGLYERACVSGDPRGCGGLASPRLDGFERGCAAGDHEACATGSVVAHNVGRRDLSARLRRRASVLLWERCDGGDGAACLVIADRDIARDGGALPRGAATELRSRACTLAAIDGCVAMTGSAGAKDFDVLAPACEAGHRRACSRLEENFAYTP